MSEMKLIRKDDATLDRLKVEDANSPVCYRLVCSCHANLGPVASFVERGGARIVRCGRCDLVTVVVGASVVGVMSAEDVERRFPSSLGHVANSERLLDEELVGL